MQSVLFTRCVVLYIQTIFFFFLHFVVIGVHLDVAFVIVVGQVVLENIP